MKVSTLEAYRFYREHGLHRRCAIRFCCQRALRAWWGRLCSLLP